jgi:hypothetical protein
MKVEIIEYDPNLFQKYKASRSKKTNKFDDDIRHYVPPKPPKPVKASKPTKTEVILSLKQIITEQQKKLNEKNRKRREYYQLTRERQLESKRIWGIKNKEIISERKKIAYWAKKNKEQNL